MDNLIDQSKQVYQLPYAIENFVTQQEIDRCIALYNKLPVFEPASHASATRKDYTMFDEKISIVQNIFLDKLANLFPDKDIVIDGGNFTYWHNPVPIHTDGYQTQYKPADSTLGFAVLVPLCTDTGQGTPNTVFFDQIKFGPGVAVGSKVGFTNERFDPEGIDNYTYKPFDKSDPRYTMLDFMKDEWLDGFSVQSIIPWHVGSAIIWHRSQFHCATKFVEFNSKLHLVFFVNLN